MMSQNQFGLFSDCCTFDSNIKSAVQEHENGQAEGFVSILWTPLVICA